MGLAALPFIHHSHQLHHPNPYSACFTTPFQQGNLPKPEKPDLLENNDLPDILHDVCF